MATCDERVARVRHTCDFCNHPIFEGDRYFRYVSFHGNWPHRYVRVRKEHDHPGCMYDPDDEPYVEHYEDTAQLELPMAA